MVELSLNKFSANVKELVAKVVEDHLAIKSINLLHNFS